MVIKSNQTITNYLFADNCCRYSYNNNTQ